MAARLKKINKPRLNLEPRQAPGRAVKKKTEPPARTARLRRAVNKRIPGKFSFQKQRFMCF